MRSKRDGLVPGNNTFRQLDATRARPIRVNSKAAKKPAVLWLGLLDKEHAGGRILASDG